MSSGPCHSPGHVTIYNALASSCSQRSIELTWRQSPLISRITSSALDYTGIPRNKPPAGLDVAVFSVPISIPHTDSDLPIWTGEPEYNNGIDGNPPVQ
jgi:hypothetical protein